MKKLALGLLIKWLLIPMIILGVVLYLLFAAAPGEVEAYVPMEQSRESVAVTREQVYVSYSAAESVVEEQVTSVTLTPSEMYVDASEVIGTDKGNDISTEMAAGFQIYDGPSRDVSEHAFVVNCKAMMDDYFQNILSLTEELGMTPSYTSASEVTYDYYVKNHGAVISAQGSVDNTHTGMASGAVAPAIVCRDFFADARYMERSGRYYWYQFSGEEVNDGNAYIDIMVVKNEDWEAYYQGVAVDILYIPFKLTDAKGHAYPWGAAQTYITLSGPGGNYVYVGNASGSDSKKSDVKIGSGTDFVQELATFMKGCPNGFSQYWWPTLATSNDALNLDHSSSANTVTGNQVEPYMNSQGKALAQFLGRDSAYAVVGYLVYANYENPPLNHG